MTRSLTAKEITRIRNICSQELVPFPVTGSLDIRGGSLIFSINGNIAAASKTADALLQNHLNTVTAADEHGDRTITGRGAFSDVQMKLNEGELFRHGVEVPPSPPIVAL